MRICFSKFFFLFCLLFASVIRGEEGVFKLNRRVQAHLLIKDLASAYEEVQRGLLEYPEALCLHESRIQVLAALGNEREMLAAWRKLLHDHPEQRENRPLIEEMAWGVLKKGGSSSSLVTRQIALLAAFFCQDAKGVSLLLQGMRDPNYAIRSFSVRLAGHLRDAKLIAEIKRLFEQEKMSAVRREVLKAAGQMKIVELREGLIKQMASPYTSQAEKRLAIQSLIQLSDDLHNEELQSIANSPLGEVRLLACKVISHLNAPEHLPLLVKLANDRRPAVRQAAFQSIGILHPPKDQDIIQIARLGANDSNYRTAIAAAWVLALYHPDEGGAILERYLLSSYYEMRLMAAAALKSLGDHGKKVMLRHYNQHADPYVCLNLSLGLIGQRTQVKEAAATLREILKTDQRKWCEREFGHFTAIACQTAFDEEEQTPELQNLMTRLEIFNILAILKEPGVQEALRQFLMERSWGITGAAAALLLTEGDDEAIELVRQLLHDSQSKVRLQAALILSLWSREELAIFELERGYAGSDMDLKIKILEGLGRIGSLSSLPFLMDRMTESSQTLRLVAAMALVQCVNH